MVLMADLCLDEYTDHGHCGVLDAAGEVDNDKTIALYGRVAQAQAKAGADIVAPSRDDGRPGGGHPLCPGRRGLHRVGRPGLRRQVRLGPVWAVPRTRRCTIAGGGDRRRYQQDPRNLREALREVELDVAEGADMVMIKPALPYLDVIAAVRQAVRVPVAAYHVSGEYAMVKAAAERGWLDGPAVALEQLAAIKRAGADMVLTYLPAKSPRAWGVGA